MGVPQWQCGVDGAAGRRPPRAEAAASVGGGLASWLLVGVSFAIEPLRVGGWGKHTGNVVSDVPQDEDFLSARQRGRSEMGMATAPQRISSTALSGVATGKSYCSDSTNAPRAGCTSMRSASRPAPG